MGRCCTRRRVGVFLGRFMQLLETPLSSRPMRHVDDVLYTEKRSRCVLLISSGTSRLAPLFWHNMRRIRYTTIPQSFNELS